MAFSGSYNDNSAATSAATANLSGMTVGGGGYGRSSQLPGFIQAKMGGTVTEGRPAYLLPGLIAAALVAVLLLKKG